MKSTIPLSRVLIHFSGHPATAWAVRARACSADVRDRLVCAFLNNIVDQAIGPGLFSTHEVVTICVVLDRIHGLTSVIGKYPVEFFPDQQDFPGVNVDIGGLSLEASQGLVDHDAGMWQAKTLALGTTGQQKRPHAGGLTDTHGADIGLDKLHGVVDCKTGRYRATR